MDKGGMQLPRCDHGDADSMTTRTCSTRGLRLRRSGGRGGVPCFAGPSMLTRTLISVPVSLQPVTWTQRRSLPRPLRDAGHGHAAAIRMRFAGAATVPRSELSRSATSLRRAVVDGRNDFGLGAHHWQG